MLKCKVLSLSLIERDGSKWKNSKNLPGVQISRQKENIGRHFLVEYYESPLEKLITAKIQVITLQYLKIHTKICNIHSKQLNKLINRAKKSSYLLMILDFQGDR